MILALSATDYGILAAALVTVLGAFFAGIVQVINALKGNNAASQARHDDVIAKLDAKQ